MDAHITFGEKIAESHLVQSVVRAFDQAMVGDGKLSPEALSLNGMSGRKYRLFINDLIGALPDARYLEVGVWKGSTLCSAIDQNPVSALAIDNWSQFGGPAQDFLTNLARFKHGACRVSFLENDFRRVDFASIGSFNVYLFDGPHSAANQEAGIVLAQPALDNQFVLIVDDWNWIQVREGTMSGIRKAGLSIDYHS
jgi:Methyltransferase domain